MERPRVGEREKGKKDSGEEEKEGENGAEREESKDENRRDDRRAEVEGEQESRRGLRKFHGKGALQGFGPDQEQRRGVAVKQEGN